MTTDKSSLSVTSCERQSVRKPLLKMTLVSGKRLLKCVMASARMQGGKVGVTDRRSLSKWPVAMAETAAAALSALATMVSAYGRRLSPASLSLSPWALLSKSGLPSSASNWETALATVDCVRLSSTDARLTLPVFTTAKNALTWRIFIGISVVHKGTGVAS